MGEKRGQARKPATKFAHLRKKMEKSKIQSRKGKAGNQSQLPQHAGR